METTTTIEDKKNNNGEFPSAPLRPSDPEKGPLHPHPRRLRRRCLLACLCCLSLVLIIALVAVILAFTLFKPRSPTTTLLSATVTGVSPALSFPVVQLKLNVSLYLEISVYNPNRASFDYGQGETGIFYRGTDVGSADLAPGRIPARGSAVVRCNVTLEAENFSSKLAGLVGDVLSGEVEFDTTSRIPGRVTFLGFIKRHAVAVSNCRVVVGFPDLRVKRQDCSQKTEL